MTLPAFGAPPPSLSLVQSAVAIPERAESIEQIQQWTSAVRHLYDEDTAICGYAAVLDLLILRGDPSRPDELLAGLDGTLELMRTCAGCV